VCRVQGGCGGKVQGAQAGGGIVLHSPVVCLETHMKVRGCEGKRAGAGQGQGARVQRHRLCSGHQPRHGVCVTGCVGCSGPWCRERLPPPPTSLQSRRFNKPTCEGVAAVMPGAMALASGTFDDGLLCT
jgi:hypothetical protein